eukprot:12932928-Prorocentrum_lima.AAC.1
MPGAEEVSIDISTGASFAPGGERSRTGMEVKLCGVVVHSACLKQSRTALRSCEADLVAAVTGVKLGLGVRQLPKELLDPM